MSATHVLNFLDDRDAVYSYGEKFIGDSIDGNWYEILTTGQWEGETYTLLYLEQFIDTRNIQTTVIQRAGSTEKCLATWIATEEETLERLGMMLP